MNSFSPAAALMPASTLFSYASPIAPPSRARKADAAPPSDRKSALRNSRTYGAHVPHWALRERKPIGKFANVWMAANHSEKDYKEAREKDFQIWIIAAALIMTIAFSGSILISSCIDSEGRSKEPWWKCALLWLAIMSLVASGFLAFKCIIDFFLYYLLSVNTPPSFYDEVNRRILYDPKSCGEPATSEHVSFECDTHSTTSWATAILEFVGVQSHHVAFFQSIQMLGVGIVFICSYRYNQLYPIGAPLLILLMIMFVTDTRSKAERFFTSQDALYNSLTKRKEVVHEEEQLVSEE